MSAQDDQTNQDDTVQTVRDRLRAAGTSEERMAMHLQRGTIALDGTPVTDLDVPAPPGTRINFLGG